MSMFVDPRETVVALKFEYTNDGIIIYGSSIEYP